MRKTKERISYIIKNKRKIYFRNNTIDTYLINEILLNKNPSRSENYELPISIKPKVILDIGANIGITALKFSFLFPKAKIYCFEPIAENFKLLSMNVEGLPNIKIFPFGLGKRDKILTFYMGLGKSNHGGYSSIIGSGGDHKTSAEVRGVRSLFKKLSNTNPDILKPDIIKVDTEGAEFEILTSMPTSLLSTTALIMGELHSVRDFELLLYLSRWFRIGIEKPLTKFGVFKAVNRSIPSSKILKR